MNRRAIYILIVLIVITSLAGCRENMSEEPSLSGSLAGNVQTAPSDKEENTEYESTAAPKAEVSDKSVTTHYAGEEFVKSIFATGGDMLYVYGMHTEGDYFLGCMKQESDVLQEFQVDMQENLRPFNMFVDESGQCHILWMSVEKCELDGQSFDRITYEESFITIVDNEGQCVKEINVSDLFSAERGRPSCFVADNRGNYYFENGKEIVQIGRDGTLGEVVCCEGWIEGIGIGKSGSLYCTYQKDNGDRLLAKPGTDSVKIWDTPCLSDAGQKELPSGFPIRRKALEEQIAQALKVETITNAEGKEEKLVRYEVIFEGEEKIPIYCITPEQAEQLLALIEGAEIVSQTEPKIYNVFLEEAEYYFDGAKGLEETMEVIQSRVSLYVNERI